MPLPLRHLPLAQNWDCHSCGNCCRELQIHLSDEERERIEAQGWADDPDLGSAPRFVRHGAWWNRRTRLAHKPDGSCVFLGPGNRCRIHERFGEEAKPLACRLYPYVLVPAGNHWRVGLRFACPSAAQNQGAPLAGRETDLARYTRLVEQAQQFQAQDVPPAPLQQGQKVEWPDLLRFAGCVLDSLTERTDRLERRWRKCLALAELCRVATFEKVTGGKLVDFLNLLRKGVDGEVPADPAQVPQAGWVGRLLFRQVLAVYTRKDHGANRGRATRSRLALLRTGWRFARGRGRVPPVNAFVPQTTFAQVEAATGLLGPEAEEVLERYYRVKVGSLQFCGPLNFGLAFWDGLEALALTFPVILWLARAIEGAPTATAVMKALTVVDDHFGYNPVLRTSRLRFMQKTLGRRGDLARLIAWYGR